MLTTFNLRNIGHTFIIILWHVDPLLDGDREIGDRTAAVSRQRAADNRGMVFSTQSAKQQRNGVFHAVLAEMLQAGQLEQ
jgi:hypothetical protein